MSTLKSFDIIKTQPAGYYLGSTVNEIFVPVLNVCQINELVPGKGIAINSSQITFGSVYALYNATATTTNNTPQTILSIPVSNILSLLSSASETAFLVKTRLVLTSGIYTGIIVFTVRISAALNGTVYTLTITDNFDTWNDADPTLANASGSLTSQGNNLNLVITGISSTTIYWTSLLQILGASSNQNLINNCST